MKNLVSIKTLIALCAFLLFLPNEVHNEVNEIYTHQNLAAKQASAKRVQLSGRWTHPPDIVICDNVITINRAEKAIQFWKRLGYKFGKIEQEEDVLKCSGDIYSVIKIMMPTNNDDMAGKIAVTQTTKIETTGENIAAEIKIWSWGVNKELVLEHEIGHALGWLHSGTRYHIMFPEWVGIGHSASGVNHSDYISYR